MFIKQEGNIGENAYRGGKPVVKTRGW